MPHPSTVIPLPAGGPGPPVATNFNQKEANTLLPYGSESGPTTAIAGQAFSPTVAGNGPGNNGGFSSQQPAAYYVQVSNSDLEKEWCITPFSSLSFHPPSIFLVYDLILTLINTSSRLKLSSSGAKCRPLPTRDRSLSAQLK